ncbi:hypothetical protein DFH09DRAFT_1145624 [Mycena vulgaris]|nr:hypothetical protein DFH09DRAFT_1145624 [Mycena vulgaris]
MLRLSIPFPASLRCTARYIRTAAPGLPQRSRRQLTQAGPTSTRSTFDPRDHNTWYRTRIPLPQYWSCDWAHWDNATQFQDDGYMSAKIMRVMFGVAGEVEPLAFIPESVAPEPTFVFCAAGVYYWYTYGELTRYEGPFADHDDFLRRLGDKEIWAGGIYVHAVRASYRSERTLTRLAQSGTRLQERPRLSGPRRKTILSRSRRTASPP